MKIIRFERVPNKYGIMINKNCASCANKSLDDFARRNCRLTRKMVRASNVCDSWQMSSQLENLGCEHGYVQRREYQLTLLEVRASEVLAEMKGLTISPKPLEDIRKEFEDQHGSRYFF